MSKWITEFGEEYQIPQRVLDLIDSGYFEDISWHNDASPSFAHAIGKGLNIILWVEHPNRSEWDERSFPEELERVGRYLVNVEDEKGRRGYPYDVMSTSNLEDALAAIETEARRIASGGGPPPI